MAARGVLCSAPYVVGGVYYCRQYRSADSTVTECKGVESRA